MEVNQKIARWTHGQQLTPLQRAACQIIPNGFSIALSIRELVRTGYLFSAEILLRPLLERVAVISYLIQHEEALNLWERGWPYKSRPPLSKMLLSMGEGAGMDKKSNTEVAQEMITQFNSLIHADPTGLDTNMGLTSMGSFGYLSGASLNDPGKCDRICKDSAAFMCLLMLRAVQIFPEVAGPGNRYNGDHSH
jgi:hypothetical protein